jgi:hypothetical protein
MSITKIGHNWYSITAIICNQYVDRQYMDYTKKEAIQRFKKDAQVKQLLELAQQY